MSAHDAELSHEDRELIVSLRTELAALARDVAHLQEDVAEIRVVFSRLAWLVVAALGAAILRFIVDGGLETMTTLAALS